MRNGIGKVYPSYSNSEKDREVCRPSRERGVHDGYDRRKQAVKMADVFGIEKVWGSIYENNREHGDFATRRSNFNMTVFGEGYSTVMRDEELGEKVVARAQHTRIRFENRCRDDEADAQMREIEGNARVFLLHGGLSVIQSMNVRIQYTPPKDGVFRPKIRPYRQSLFPCTGEFPKKTCFSLCMSLT